MPRLERNNYKRNSGRPDGGKTGTVRCLSSAWLLESAPNLKESSIIKYEDLLRCYILPELGDRELSNITNKDLLEFVNHLRTKGGISGTGLAPSTVSEVVCVMNALRLHAIKHNRKILFNPECVSIKRGKANIRVFSIEEERRLLMYLYNNMDLISLGILICLCTGIRIGELCALNWDNINLGSRTMLICGTVQRLRIREYNYRKTRVVLLPPKSPHSFRIIPLPDLLIELLEKYYTPEAFLLTGKKGIFMEPRVIQNRFKKILKSCDIKDANFHCTRHTFATRCVELGFDVKSLSEILGHSNVAITLNRYVHPTMELKAKNMNRLSELFK